MPGIQTPLTILYILFSQYLLPHLVIFFFFFNDPAPTEIYPLPLHAALPISRRVGPPASTRQVPAASRACWTTPRTPSRESVRKNPARRVLWPPSPDRRVPTQIPAHASIAHGPAGRATGWRPAPRPQPRRLHRCARSNRNLPRECNAPSPVQDPTTRQSPAGRGRRPECGSRASLNLCPPVPRRTRGRRTRVQGTGANRSLPTRWPAP